MCVFSSKLYCLIWVIMLHCNVQFGGTRNEICGLFYLASFPPIIYLIVKIKYQTCYLEEKRKKSTISV